MNLARCCNRSIFSSAQSKYTSDTFTERNCNEINAIRLPWPRQCLFHTSSTTPAPGPRSEPEVPTSALKVVRNQQLPKIASLSNGLETCNATARSWTGRCQHWCADKVLNISRRRKQSKILSCNCPRLELVVSWSLSRLLRGTHRQSRLLGATRRSHR